MKELSIEDKAKAYDEAYKKVAVRFGSNVADEIFLKESEDERIRKELIEFVKSRDGFKQEYIAWLEKQGKNNMGISEATKQKLEDNLNKALEKETPESFNKFLDEQKPTDKVEPKFKVGDWIIHNKNIELANSLMLVTSKSNNTYLCKDIDGQCSYNIEFIDKDYHLWTIQDAKDGDVLCTYECDEPKIVFILKGTPKKNYALGYHCFYNIMYPHFASDSEKGCLAPNDEDVKPATKKQCDLLFQKMKEAGYEWDADEKKLNKIEQDAWTEEDEKNLNEALSYIKDEILKNFIKNRVQLQPKQKWNEEDGKRLSDIIVFASDYATKEVNKEWVDFLKSLRPQNWTREDKERYISCLQKLSTGNPEQPETINSKWFKEHVYPQNTWKPSEEQMKMLDEVLNFAANHESPYWNDCIFGILNNLIRQLKKLKS